MFFFFFCRDPGAHPATLPAGAVLVLAVQADTKPRGLLRDVWAGRSSTKTCPQACGVVVKDELDAATAQHGKEMCSEKSHLFSAVSFLASVELLQVWLLLK